jgi:mRNA interferase MazF
MPKPNRGEIWLVDLGMAAKVRPCLVLGAEYDDNDRALVTDVPHSTSIRHSNYEVTVELKFLRPGVFVTQNLITIPAAKFLRKLGQMSKVELKPVENSVRNWLGL